ncbi:alpha/beta fold hydrolase [Alkalicoccobacillus murimartini]|uniref:Pimeloyl-ACP methyl ester carboxylesterase n=1 Tax=Alkalicoccobacillus murimartini TaxID=171685 RepID=A0ABT9YHS2_9BACI|nr:alpha/beta hydrolase [Alkalicoccobacillus murimartini]MDQ0206579.1 pimeloyl-ACP methyl ester carboxylesterase [Alkalicoccobacillus murimartini]
MGHFELTKRFTSTFGEIQFEKKGDGPALVLVHGTPWSSFNWRHIIPSLSQWFTVYYYDLVGYGKSEKAEAVSLDIQSKVLKELLTYWKLDNPIVIGHDFGGTTVLRTHLLEKVAFKKMILIDPVALAPWGSPFFSHVNKFESAFTGLPEKIHRAIVTDYIQGAMYHPMSTETMEGILDPWLGISGQAAFYRQIAQANQSYTDELEPLYQTIEIPTLLIWGEEDQWIPIKKGEELHQRIKTSTFMNVPFAGHLIQEDQPTRLLGYLLKDLLN